MDPIAKPARIELRSNSPLEGVILARSALHSAAYRFSGLQILRHC
ncbi:hypothetical protein Agau_P200409 (plasmid) [Agrobacterium tumefaciens F2]|nr:hypothetical protein Agau_P200409 [Agrobacterium tumefaciens F2]